ncbi:class I SAM-dependent methyltransferase [Hylemonella gracilis]|jgi:cyclopropane-fatty-acyl-phospholipid synthase|uniref:Class I SAM-dependent methyltransferase n=1 Tax=Hylemonella gracilis TaxID=80880 RepID=A0A4V1A1X5_9BURK|nr:cyclopropane-fatty-acyl-phospholipid synthase family protein [Hylemonella gracilis]QBK04069.1 class I SAM-dependent methyltransferase [Hylemonella gracilis]
MVAASKMESALTPWVAKLKKKINLPVLVQFGENGGGGGGLKLGDFDTPLVTIRLRKPSAVTHLLSPSLDSLGEAYVEGLLDVEGRVADILALGHQMAEAGSQTEGRLTRIVRQFKHTKKSDKEAIQYHYDVSNAFYQTWLDPRMVYSCAYFENGDETLEAAQLKKIDHILTKAQVRPGHRLLDIGCGWGALVIRAAQHYGARCVGVTLSQNQFDLATERVKAAGLQDRIEIRLQDYRDVEGQFDRITSVGMFEHVGLNYLEAYFAQIRKLLTDDGWVLNHGITSTDANNGETSHGGGRFVDRYVFPQGELPHISTVLRTMQLGGLEALDVESLRRHYMHTTRLWSEAFEAGTAQLRGMVPEKTWRIWRIYLAGCQWAFDNDEISLYQVLCGKSGRPSSALPWSRRWMYER